MARHYKKMMFTGTIGNVTFYMFRGRYVARAKSSLTRKQIAANPNFDKFRENGLKWGLAARLSSEIYQGLPKHKKKHQLFMLLKGKAYNLLAKENWPEEKVRVFLSEVYC